MGLLCTLGTLDEQTDGPKEPNPETCLLSRNIGGNLGLLPELGSNSSAEDKNVSWNLSLLTPYL